MMNDLKEESLLELLEVVNKARTQIVKRSYEQINFSSPIISLGVDGIIYPHTLTIIQGKKGCHKSRLTESICSLLLARTTKTDRLGMSVDFSKKPYVLYVDTERNQREQFPYAIQQLRKKAGFKFEEKPANLDYLSLIDVPRARRFEVLKEYINSQDVAKGYHRIIVLDIVTDCVESFNDPKESMKLIDMINVLINQQEVSFICTIHENPGIGEKARGHLGTELINKASQVIQIGYNDDKKELINIKFLHSRMTRPIEPIYAQFDEGFKGLVRADKELINAGEQNRLKSAKIENVKDWLQENLPTLEIVKLGELYKYMSSVFECGERTIETRIKSLLEDQFILSTGPGNGAGKFIKLNLQLKTQPQ